jgi:hypothetical protein
VSSFFFLSPASFFLWGGSLCILAWLDFEIRALGHGRHIPADHDTFFSDATAIDTITLLVNTLSATTRDM